MKAPVSDCSVCEQTQARGEIFLFRRNLARTYASHRKEPKPSKTNTLMYLVIEHRTGGLRPKLSEFGLGPGIGMHIAQTRNLTLLKRPTIFKSAKFEMLVRTRRKVFGCLKDILQRNRSITDTTREWK